MRSLSQEASLGTNDIAVDSGGHSACWAMVDRDSCINAEQTGRKTEDLQTIRSVVGCSKAPTPR